MAHPWADDRVPAGDLGVRWAFLTELMSKVGFPFARQGSSLELVLETAHKPLLMKCPPPNPGCLQCKLAFSVWRKGQGHTP